MSIVPACVILALSLASCGARFSPAGEVRFDDTETITAIGAADLDRNGRLDVVAGVSSSASRAADPVFATLFLFERSDRSWKYLWKSYPLNRSDRRLETVADEVRRIAAARATNDRRLLIETDISRLQLGFRDGHYVLEPGEERIDATPGVDKDLSDYFRFPFTNPVFYVTSGREYLLLTRESGALEIYRFRPESERAFHRVFRISIGRIDSFVIVDEPGTSSAFLCAGCADHRLVFYRIRGL